MNNIHNLLQQSVNDEIIQTMILNLKFLNAISDYNEVLYDIQFNVHPLIGIYSNSWESIINVLVNKMGTIPGVAKVFYFTVITIATT